VDLDILSCKPDHVSDLEDMGHMFVPFELFLYLLLEELECCFSFLAYLGKAVPGVH
jgi:hypothetical protein